MTSSQQHIIQESSMTTASKTPLWKQEDAVPFLQIKNVTKKFDDFTAVDNVSLDIYKEELFCLLGGSGSGKSTLLRMLAGFEEPTSGSILIDGVECSNPTLCSLTLLFLTTSPLV